MSKGTKYREQGQIRKYNPKKVIFKAINEFVVNLNLKGEVCC